MSFLSGKRLLLIGFLAVLLAAIPLTVYFLQSQTRTQSGATPATTLYFALPGQTTQVTTPIQKNIGDSFDIDVIINPSTNQVIATTLFITYDATKLELLDNGLKPTMIETASQTEGFTSILAGPTYTQGTATVTLAVGVDVTKVIKTTQKIARVSFKTLAAATDTKVSFDSTKTNVTSSVDPEINVLSTASPVSIAIAQSTAPTATPTLAFTPTPTVNVGIGNSGPTGTPTPTVVGNQIPVCTGLNVDRVTTGPAPFSVTFTANGNDPNGTISKVTFDFGDSPVSDVTTGGGIGTKTASVQMAHTYNNAGVFKARATFTDNNGSISAASDSCLQTITVTAAVAGTPAPTVAATETPTPTLTPTPTPTEVLAINPSPTIEQPGPGSTLFGIGLLGVALLILGSFIFIAL